MERPWRPWRGLGGPGGPGRPWEAPGGPGWDNNGERARVIITVAEKLEKGFLV